MKTIDKEQYGYDREDIVKMRTALVEAREFIAPLHDLYPWEDADRDRILDLIRSAL